MDLDGDGIDNDEHPLHHLLSKAILTAMEEGERSDPEAAGMGLFQRRDLAINMTAYFSFFSPCCFSPLNFLLGVFP